MQGGKACHFKKEELEVITKQARKQNTCCYRLIDLWCTLSWQWEDWLLPTRIRHMFQCNSFNMKICGIPTDL